MGFLVYVSEILLFELAAYPACEAMRKVRVLIQLLAIGKSQESSFGQNQDEDMKMMVTITVKFRLQNAFCKPALLSSAALYTRAV